MDVRTARGLTDVGVGLESRYRGFGIAGRQGTLVVADDIRLAEARVRLEQWGPVVVLARQRPHAPVDPQLDDAPVIVAVSRYRNRHLDAPFVAIERHHRLFDATPRREDSLHPAEHRAALGQPG